MESLDHGTRIRKLTGSVRTQSHALNGVKQQLRLNSRVQADITPFGQGTGSARHTEGECCHAEAIRFAQAKLREASLQLVVGW